MSAKLYRVRITEISMGFNRVEIHDRWVSAISRKQAEQRGLESLGRSHIKERTHVHVDCYRGGVAYNSSATLRKEPTP